ncbi:oligodendrocyte-myelin glycoprotein isoform X1 [Epinephelus moara]|uniref:oligodendrocyte-myelin glycoprotein isoform X1 n=1 Tax=Epinephelus moara TaxID=300413 RepID=UPI00214E54B8|nr:oligodendrocyte-myelin glycoprotein isoform X1 [Epinephelus moara]
MKLCKPLTFLFFFFFLQSIHDACLCILPNTSLSFSRALTMPVSPASLLCLFLLLLCGLLGGWVLSICPTVCSCSHGHRVVDCSSRGLTKLPPGLQHNIHFLNLSFNSLQHLENQLTHYAHLRTLDLSYNRLETLPPALPRSLWDMRVAGNHLRLLDKNDTAYHWNLKVLDLSDNELERVVFINNTLPSLKALNLSHNRFWTVPTNMPHNLESIDLSHNYLMQILPGSLDRLPRLAKFYLHANRFSWLYDGIFDKLMGLEVMTLGDNPWACEEEENITKLLTWAEQTRATILGCPCYTRPICGQTHQATPGREWHSALFTEPPLWVNSRGEEYNGQSPARTAEITSSSQVKSALFETGIYQDKRGVNESGDLMRFAWTSPTSFDSFSTHTSTTPSPESLTKRPKVANSNPAANRNKCRGLVIGTQQTVALTVLVLTTAFNNF